MRGKKGDMDNEKVFNVFISCGNGCVSLRNGVRRYKYRQR